MKKYMLHIIMKGTKNARAEATMAKVQLVTKMHSLPASKSTPGISFQPCMTGRKEMREEYTQTIQVITMHLQMEDQEGKNLGVQVILRSSLKTADTTDTPQVCCGDQSMLLKCSEEVSIEKPETHCLGPNLNISKVWVIWIMLRFRPVCLSGTHRTGWKNSGKHCFREYFLFC